MTNRPDTSAPPRAAARGVDWLPTAPEEAVHQGYAALTQGALGRPGLPGVRALPTSVEHAAAVAASSIGFDDRPQALPQVASFGGRRITDTAHAPQHPLPTGAPAASPARRRNDEAIIEVAAPGAADEEALLVDELLVYVAARGTSTTSVHELLDIAEAEQAGVLHAVPPPPPAPISDGPDHHAVVDESPEAWLERMWGETGQYALDPAELDRQFIEEETHVIIDGSRRSITQRLAVMSLNRPKLVLGLWLLMSLAFAVGGSIAGTNYARDYQLTSGKSREAAQLLHDREFLPPASENVLVRSRTKADTRSAGFVRTQREIVAMLEKHHLVANVTSPLAPELRPVLTAEDSTAVVIPVELTGRPSDTYLTVDDLERDVDKLAKLHPGYSIEMLGDASAKRATLETSEEIASLSEILTVPTIVVVLVLVLGSFIAATMPAILAVSAVAAATGLASLLSIFVPASPMTSAVITLVGMAVGTDYVFFVLRRVREERDLGRSIDEAILVSASTSGRAIVVSGITVVIATAGLFLSDTRDFYSIALGTILVVSISVLGATTALPAMLRLLGDRVARTPDNWLARRFANESARRMRRTPWTRLVSFTLKRPAPVMIVVVSLLLLLTWPALSMKTQLPGFADVNPPDSAEVDTFEHLERDFPGEVTPAVIAVDVTGRSPADVAAATAAFHAAAIRSGAANEPIIDELSKDGTTLRIHAPLADRGKDDEGDDAALTTLRRDVLPATLEKDLGRAMVTGPDAEDHDFSATNAARSPWVYGFVIVLTFLLLLVSFRSIVVPIKATILNVLSVGATYGVLTLVFQHGYGASLLGAESTGSVATWLPLFLFVIMFGLSMDYHVFILSRVRELWLGGTAPDRAVVMGIGGTSRTVTASALVMVGVFVVFMAMPTLDMKQLGLGLTVGVAIDAWLIRGLLLPASMKLLGSANWYLPTWLEWMPRTEPEVQLHRHDERERLSQHVPLNLALDLGRISAPQSAGGAGGASGAVSGGANDPAALPEQQRVA